MKILAIDTSTKYLSLAIFDGKNTYLENLELGRRHSELLMIIIQRAIGSLGWKLADLDYLACGLGPGSFTGVRVGISTIKGISWALKKPIAGFSSLDLLAANALGSDAKYIIPLVDARRNLVYYSIYRKDKGTLKRIAPYRLSEIEGVAKNIKPGSLLLGDGLSLYKDKIQALVNRVSFLDKDYWFVRAEHLIKLALEEIKKKRILDSQSIKPIYLYPAACQVRKLKVKS